MSDLIKKGTVTLFAAALLLASASVVAQQLDVRTVVQKEERVRAESGEIDTRLVPADTVLPGEKVVYTITFTNVGGETAGDVVVSNPIDSSLTYVDGSAFGAGMSVEFSVDGGQSYATADDLVIAEGTVSRPAEPEDYTHIRWTLDGELEAGATGVARFSATVD
ncbi:MAG: hypothetical protein QNI96_14675 [Woeseiaceae bacterium]|nr:hypothetical protein [Woeseiaceae bacterium]